MSRSRSQNAKRSRSKGAAWEREIATMLAPLWPQSDVRRNLSQSRSARREGGDVIGSPFHIEAKVGAHPNVEAALVQGERDAAGSAPVLVIAKRDRCEPVVFCRLSVLTRRETDVVPITLTLARFVSLLTPASLEPTS
jgi:hypothetical protein